ncbi:uncharacterized protein LOC132202358 isoform X2 [Neocloeon triangulifer]|nr:uncharacterized protein LOC132202358 isoform X2 [Neocloeon triangulifer]
MRQRRSTTKRISSLVIVSLLVGSVAILLFLHKMISDLTRSPTEPIVGSRIKNPFIASEIIPKQSVPSFVMKHLDGEGPRLAESYGRYPNPMRIKYNNIYWQVQEMDNKITYYLYGAYYDNRTLLPAPTVRVLGHVNRYQPNKLQNLSCQLWFKDDPKPIVVKVFEFFYLYRHEWHYLLVAPDLLEPYFVNCLLPPKLTGGRIPESVSLVEEPWHNATNNLRVLYTPTPSGGKKKFAVCVKGLNFYHDATQAVRIVEWLELLRILGADKVFFYQYHVHPKIGRVLQHYENEGFAEVIKITLPGFYPNIPEFQNTFFQKNIDAQELTELIHYNDFLYKNLNLFEYLVPIDIDEVIVPRSAFTWHELLNKVIPKSLKSMPSPVVSYVARNVMFMDDMAEMQDFEPEIPRYMHMLQHVHRNSRYSEFSKQVKCIHRADRAVALHNHYVLACLSGFKNFSYWAYAEKCQNYHMDTEDAHLQHYCIGKTKYDCRTRAISGELTVDTTLWKYKNQLIAATTEVLKKTGVLP